MLKSNLVEKLKNKTAKIGVVGVGYVGLPLAIRFTEIGYKVTAIDIAQERVEAINTGNSYIGYIPSERIANACAAGLNATTNFSYARELDALILCVPTPLNKYREPDLGYIVSTLSFLLPHLRKGQVISLESTTYPGTTEEILKPTIEKLGFVVGEDIFLVYSPEREDPGNLHFNSSNTPKICGGISNNCLEIGVALYEQIVPRVIKVSSAKTAEMTKLLENIHRAVNIGLMNELKQVAHKMDIDIFEVIQAAATKPFGFVPYYPGPGIGGHCIPLDPFYLTWKAREFGLHTRFIELAGEINSSMPEWVVNRLATALNESGKALKICKILICGLSYKKDVDDIRESPSIEIIKLLQMYGAQVDYSDPYVPIFKSYHSKDFNMESVSINAEMLKQYDAVLLATAHTNYDYELIKKHAKLIVDTRGKYHADKLNKIFMA